jgi:hypothetical protein
MTGRDRMVAMAVGVLAVLAAMWLLVVSPERQKASKLGGEVTSAQSQLSAAENQLASAHAAQVQYSKAYTTVVRLGKAVPAEEEVPSLIYQLNHATHQRDVGFESIVPTESGDSSSSSSSSSTSSSATPGAAPTTFTQMPFTFTFAGGFFDLERLFHQLTSFSTLGPNGTPLVSGRLLTIQSVKLAPGTDSGGASQAAKGQLTGTITATAYVLPPSQSVTGSASPASPSSSSPTPASTSAPASSPTAPAVARVTP